MTNPRLRLSEPQSQVLEVAFIAQDPAGERALELAREVVRLIRDRDDCECVAIAHELRALSFKYSRRGEPKNEASETPSPEPS